MNKIRLATIIDCEGCVGITNCSEGYKRPQIQISQNERWYVARFKKEFGFGSVHPSGTPNGWQYTAYYIQALIICLTLRYEFEIKREQVEEIIKYYEHKLLNGTVHARKILVSKMKRYSLSFKNGKWIKK